MARYLMRWAAGALLCVNLSLPAAEPPRAPTPPQRPAQPESPPAKTPTPGAPSQPPPDDPADSVLAGRQSAWGRGCSQGAA